MKRFKKILAMVVTMAMVMAMALPAMASTVTNNTDHTYNVYQIFSGTQGDQADDPTALGDIQWGTGIADTDAFIAALKADTRFGSGSANIFYSATTAAEVAKALDGATDDGDIAKAFANVAEENKGTVYATVEGNATSPDLVAGYYLFSDTTEIDDEDTDAKNSALLQITNDSAGLTIAKKYSVPELDKDITGINDTDVEIEAADANVGDTIEYTMTGTLPSNYSDYESYAYKFKDTLSAGLAYQGDLKVYLNEVVAANEITTGVVVAPTAATDGSSDTSITVTFANLKTNASIDKDSKIIVVYTAVVTKDAVTTSAGNANTATIEFSNNPNKGGSGDTSETPEDTNLVFTYELDTTKVDGATTGKTLQGAKFKLKATSGDYNGKWATVDASGNLTGWVTAEADATELESDSDGNFVVKGLDSGTYELKETQAPTGYNLLTSNIAITITADITGDETGTEGGSDYHDTVTPAINSLNITVDGEQDTTDYKATGQLPVTIENNSGSVLPSTGGIGTTIFYVVGAILVIGAGVVLITRRRMDA